MLPPGWIELQLSQIADVVGGLTKGQKDRVGDAYTEVPYLRVANVQRGYLNLREVLTIRASSGSVQKLALRNGDLLFTEGGDRDKLGRGWVWECQIPICIHQNHIFRARLRCDDIDPRYISWFANTEGVRYFLFEGKQTTNLASVSLTKLKGLPIRLPPVAEHHRIVAKIDALTAKSRRAKEALDAIPPLLDKLRQSILAAAFRGDLTADWRAAHPDVEPASKLLDRIRTERRRRWEEGELAKMNAKGKAPADDRWKAKYQEPEAVDESGLPELPEGWCWSAWRQVGFCQNGRAFPSNEYGSDGIKLLRPGNLHVGGTVEWTPDNTRRMPQKWADQYPDHIVRGDELIMNLTAQSLKDEFLGRVCLTEDGEESLLNQRLARLTPVMISCRWCLYWMKSPRFRGFVDSLNTGSLIQHMFTSQVEDHALPIPPIEEQQAMVDIIDSLFARQNAAETLLNDHGSSLHRLDATILAKAFRGELVPQDPNDEPASALLELIRTESGVQSKQNSRRRKVKSA